MTVTDYPDYAEPQANATAISTTGTPLLHGASKLTTINLAVPAGATVRPNIQFAKCGYLINARPQYSGANGATPFCQVDWLWADANPKTLDLGEQRWIVPVHQNLFYSPVLGRGPVGAPFAELDITNLDGAQPIAFMADIWETTQHIARDDWRDSSVNGFLAPPGFVTAPGADPSRNELAMPSVTINTVNHYILPLYAGQAWLALTITPAAGATGEVQIGPLNNGGFCYDSGQVTAKTLINDLAITLPREPCQLVLAASAGNVTFTLTLIAMEYAS